MKIAVFTRSMNEEYYNLMVSLLPDDIECHRVTGFNHWSEAKDYLYNILDLSELKEIDFAVNIDEDCFITDWSKVIDIINHMKATNKSHAGMPDGGCHPGRTRSIKVQNPFFNVFNVKMCNEILYLTEKKNNSLDFDFDKMPYDYSDTYMTEPFDRFFLKLYNNGIPLHLYADLHEDGITTILKWKDKPFVLHTWYSRDASHRERILQRFEEAKQLSNGNI